MLLYTTNTDTKFICNFLIFLIIKITLLQNCFSRVCQLFDNFFYALHPFFDFIRKCICILFGDNPIKISILFFNLPMPQIIYTAVPCLYIQIGCNCFRLQILKILPSFLKYIIDNILTYLFVRNETKGIIIQTSIVLFIQLLKTIYL